MLPISRRRLLATSALVLIAACSDDSATDTTSTSADTLAGDTSTATTTPPTSTPPATSPSTTIPATTTSTTTPPIDFGTDPFTLGVASGDPDATSVVLWTRLAPDPLAADGDGGMSDLADGNDVTLTWEVASDEGFDDVVAQGQSVATAAHGYTVHEIVTLDPGVWFYRFTAGEFHSQIGRTVIAAPDATTARFVSATCQNYEDAYFHAHADIAAQQPDFLVWLGDYIYEGAGVADVIGEGNVRSHASLEIIDLAAYRNRYALYKQEPELRAAHASCPWFVIWDDHEVENNYAATTPQDPADAATFAQRRAVAYQAWWEHQPTRLGAPSADIDAEYRIYRAVTWGPVIGLVLLDGRQYRDDQACGDVALSFDPACDEAFQQQRTMLGTAQEQFVADTLGQQGTMWNVLGQQTVLLNLGLGDAILNFDQWDGYPAARDRLTANLAAARVPNCVVLTGDIHLAGVGLVRNGEAGVGAPVAVEFVATSISSNGLLDPELEAAVNDFADVVDAELAHRGYIVHTVTETEWTADYRIVDDAKSATPSPTRTYKSFVVNSGVTDVQVV